MSYCQGAAVGCSAFHAGLFPHCRQNSCLPQAGHSGKAAAEERCQSGEEASTSVGVFELIDRQGADVVSASRRRVRPPPVSREEWGSFLDAEGAHPPLPLTDAGLVWVEVPSSFTAKC